jgi:hypothetical protein
MGAQCVKVKQRRGFRCGCGRPFGTGPWIVRQGLAALTAAKHGLDLGL